MIHCFRRRSSILQGSLHEGGNHRAHVVGRAHYIAAHLKHLRLEQAYGLGDLAEGCNLFAESKNCRLFFLDSDRCFRVRTFRRILSALMAISVSGLCRRTANFAGACICRPAAATKAAGVHGAHLPAVRTQIRISQSHNKNLLK